MKWERESPTCIVSKQEQDLIHFGTPGMKWGVRREIGKLAREHAVLSTEQRLNKSSLRRIENKIARKKEQGKSTLRLEQKRANEERAIRIVDRTLKKNYSKLSQKDIQQGKRSFVNRTIFGAFLAGPMGALIGATVPMIRAQNKRNEIELKSEILETAGSTSSNLASNKR